MICEHCGKYSKEKFDWKHHLMLMLFSGIGAIIGSFIAYIIKGVC
jgi:uncharacterized membrane protein YfcA